MKFDRYNVIRTYLTIAWISDMQGKRGSSSWLRQELDPRHHRWSIFAGLKACSTNVEERLFRAAFQALKEGRALAPGLKPVITTFPFSRP